MKNRDRAKPPPFHAPGRRRAPPGVANPGERLWRVRKQQRAIDALLRHHGDGVGVELQFLLEGELALGRLYPTREVAVAAADDKRRELERAGWIHHW
jgi:hypothetical protein